MNLQFTFCKSTTILVSFSLLLSHLPCHNAITYSIKTTWNNVTIDSADYVLIELGKHDSESFKIDIQAPFYNDPPRPDKPGQEGEPMFGLWDFELIKVFFLNNLNQYIEIELGAWGHHFVLLCNGYRHTIRYGMLINYTANRAEKRWNGTAIIPTSYLPVNINKINIYSYHGSGDKRIVNALYPVANSTVQIDDHKIDSYQPFNWTEISTEPSTVMSSVWTDSINRIRSLKIAHTWKGKALSPNETVDLHLQVDSSYSNLVLNVNAPFYKDPAPTQPIGPYAELYTQGEVVHLYLLSYPDFKYLEVQVGPWGHYQVVFWNGYYNRVGNLDSTIKYSVDRLETRWNGTALIPLSYLPPKVYLVNAHSSHGVASNNARVSNSLYPVPQTSNQTGPDFHNFKYYKFIDFTELYHDNENPECSKVWQDFNVCKNSANPAQMSSVLMILINALVLYLFFN